MRQEDVEAVRHGYEAWNRGDVDAVLELVHPDIEWRPGEDAPEAGENQGRGGFRGFIESWLESFEDLNIVPQELLIEGDCVIAVVHQRGRGRGSGVEIDVVTAHVWEIEDGRAVGWYAFRNRTAALAGVKKRRVELVQRGYEAFNAGDIEGSLEGLHPEIEWHTYIVPGPGGGVYHGHDGVRELWADAKKVFGGFKNIPERVFEAGDHVVAFVRIEGVGTQSGIPVQARIAHLYSFRDGMISCVQSFEDRDEALRAAGVEAAPD
jgi:ketosteroid isomerase-like protein